MVKRSFNVYIIESPSAVDLYHKRFEGESLERALKLSGINAFHKLAVKKESFMAAFQIGLKEYFQSNSVSPIIHISAHGNENGIQLTSGEEITWSELRHLLLPINKVLNGQLLVCMSSCKGFSGCVMAMEDDNFPFLAVVGSTSQPTWGETNIAYSSFYHLFAKGEELQKAVDAMNVASGNATFLISFSSSARKSYLQALAKVYVNNIDQRTAIATMNSKIPKEFDTLNKALK